MDRELDELIRTIYNLAFSVGCGDDWDEIRQRSKEANKAIGDINVKAGTNIQPFNNMGTRA